MLKRLEVQGFKKHDKRIEVELSKGLNLVVGPNYSGKTSLLTSILFALGGVSVIEGGSQAAINPNAKTEVLLEFSHGGFTHRIKRTASSAEYWSSNGREAKGTKAVNDAITDIFGAKVKDLAKVCYSAQGFASALATDMGAGELNRLVESLTGADEAETILAIIKDRLSNLSGALSVLEQQAGGLDELKEKLEGLQAELKEVSKQICSVDEVRSLYMEKLEAKQKETEELTSLVHKAENKERLEREIEQLESRYQKKREEIAFIEGALDQIDEDMNLLVDEYDPGHVLGLSFEEILAEIAGKLADNEENERKIAEAERNRSRLNKEINEVNQRIDDLIGTESELEQTELALLKADEEYNSVCDRISAAKSKRKELQSFIEGGECSACGRPFEDVSEEHLESSRREYDELERKLNELEVTRSSLYERKGKLVKHKDKLIGRAKLKEELEERLSSLKDQLDDLTWEFPAPLSLSTKESLEDMLSTGSNLKAAWNAKWAERQKHVEIYQMLNEDLGLKQAEYEEEYAHLDLPSVKELVEKSKALRNRVTELDEKYADVEQELSELETQATSLRTQIQVTKQRIRQAEESREQYVETKRKVDVLKLIRKTVQSTRSTYLSDAWTKLMTYTTQFCRTATGNHIQQVTREGDKFFFYEDGEKRVLESASGAQRSLIGLGLKAGLVKMLPTGLDFLILDEPTADMDDVHSAAAMRIFKDSGLQVVSVTHRELDKGMADTIIELAR